jgi:hypothetical protein
MTQNLSHQPLVHYGQTFWEGDFKNNPKTHWGRKLAKCIHFDFPVHHSTTLQCMKLRDHVTLNFNNNVSTAAAFFNIKKSFDTTGHPGLLYKLSELEFLMHVIRLIVSSFTNRKFKVLVGGEFYAHRNSGRCAQKFRSCPNIVVYI